MGECRSSPELQFVEYSARYAQALAPQDAGTLVVSRELIECRWEFGSGRLNARV